MFIPDQESRAAFQSFMQEARLRIGRERAATLAAPASTAEPGRRSGARSDGGRVLRVVRETEAGARVKALHHHRWQACGVCLEGDQGPYAEAAYIRPLAHPHNGPDKLANLLCLCPNHHVLFERGGFTVGGDLGLIGLPGRLRLAGGHPVGRKYLAYHRRLWAGGAADGQDLGDR